MRPQDEYDQPSDAYLDLFDVPRLPANDAEEARKNKAFEKNENFSPALHQRVGRLVYLGVECPLYGDDIWNNAWDWEPTQKSLSGGRFLDAIAETPVWTDPELRRGAASRRGISRKMFEALLNDPNPQVRGMALINDDGWGRLSVETALALAKTDPFYGRQILRCRRSKKDLRRIAEALLDDADPHVAWFAQERLASLKKSGRKARRAKA